MRLPRAWKRWFDLRLVSGLFRAPVPWLEYVQDYFVQRYNSNGDPEPFSRGILAFAVGYCPARQIMEKCIRAPNPEGGIVRITEPDFLDALDWIDHGIREMSSSDRRKSKKEAIFYCCALGEFSAFLDLAGADEAALRCIEHSIEFGREYAARWVHAKRLDKLNEVQALYLARAGRYEEAIERYPSKGILHAIRNMGSKGSTPGAMIDMLPYVQAVIENARDPNGRCGADDLEYANRWLSEFYFSSGSYADMMAINVIDIIGSKVGKKKNRNAVTAYLHFAVGALEGGLVDYAKSALSTAYRMAEEVLSHYVDENANLFYQIFFTYFQIYLLEPNLEEASFVLNRALEFLNERVDAQRAKRGENTAIALVDVDAREQIMLYKAGLLSAQGERLEALRFSDWVADSHGGRRRKRADGCRDVFDRFYMEALAFNVLAILRAEGGRTPRADGQIGEMLRESVHIAEDLKLITLDHARADAICDMQDWANLIFSYWVEFPDHTISAEDLYQFELNTKNIDPHIRCLQNRALQSRGSPGRDAVNRERRELWGNYQKEAFESADFQTKRKQFLDRQTALDVKRYQLLKASGYELPCFEPKALQERLGSHGAVLEFREFVDHKLFPDAADPIQSEPWYGAFLITGDSAAFKPLGSAREVEAAVSELLADICDAGLLDSETVSAAKLSRAEDALLGPFREELARIEALYIVPDNELYKVPFELMPMWGGGIKICYLTSAQSILRDRGTGGSYRSIRVIADPEFRIEGGHGQESAARSGGSAAQVPEAVRGALLESGISALKYTGLEAEAIEKAFAANHGSVEVVRGRDARKDNVFAAGADILHFATHGFAILNQLEEYSREPGRPDGFLHSERARRIASSDNALLRCGLLLSGVDNWLRGAEADGFGNGILTGMDILSESLGDYRLVVLSACGTGQGAAAYSGEGIEGLRSAFELAGVPVLVCTLWDVDDFATALFMAEFYRDLQRGGSPLSALQAAKCALQSMTYADLEREGFQTQADSLFQRRMALSKEERPFAHPRYWASFILHGAALEA